MAYEYSDWTQIRVTVKVNVLDKVVAIMSMIDPNLMIEDMSDFQINNRYGEQISTRGIANQLKIFANKYKINPKVVYPHSFRHRFAKSFLDRCNDIAFLADLMGHESIETTRIYLRKTATEQREIVDAIVDW